MKIEIASVTSQATLLLCPAVTVWRHFGELLLDRKFYDGLKIYIAHWPGRVRVVMRVSEIQSPPAFGAVAYRQGMEEFDLVQLQADENLVSWHLKGVNVALVSADSFRNLHISALCRQLAIPCIHDIEYTLKTRYQMIWQQRGGLFQKLKSSAWVTVNEIKLRRALALANSVQANGIPAFNAYASKFKDGLLYFDNRMTDLLCIDQASLDARLRYLHRGKPLRLAFSGRLIASKGADALPQLAQLLKAASVPFQMHIFGAGDLEPSIALAIKLGGLSNQVYLHGPVDFEKKLLPFIQTEVDLFVCCHRQGDPSCTYIETNGCGVPIVGFANEAQAAFVKEHEVGWAVPIDDIRGLAKRIAVINGDRPQIEMKSRAALRLALRHVFIKEFSRRVAHCRSIARDL